MTDQLIVGDDIGGDDEGEEEEGGRRGDEEKAKESLIATPSIILYCINFDELNYH